ncbi:hypothetical protein FM107_17935 [Sphingobacterium sp. JB170]|nr:hypothetical protein FM107_17935 [Sphingobacterium sp. JB170]
MDYNLLEVQDSYITGGEKVSLKNLVIDRTYRFAPMNNVEDEAILYAMHNKNDGSKGVFVNGYGISADSEASEIIRQISDSADTDDDWTI